MKLAIGLSARRIATFLAVVAVCFALLSLASQLDRIYLGLGDSWGAGRLFFVGREGSIPTWYSMSLLLLSAGLLALIAITAKEAGGRDYLYWSGLSAIFLYLSADEGSGIHERVLAPLGRVMLNAVGLAPTGLVARSWVVPGMLLTLVFVLVYLRFFLRLPTRTRFLFFAAGTIFLGGSLAIEMLTAFYINSYGGAQNATPVQRAVQLALPNVEELLEMLGIVTFIYALLAYIDSKVEEVKVRMV